MFVEPSNQVKIERLDSLDTEVLDSLNTERLDSLDTEVLDSLETEPPHGAAEAETERDIGEVKGYMINNKDTEKTNQYEYQVKFNLGVYDKTYCEIEEKDNYDARLADTDSKFVENMHARMFVWNDATAPNMDRAICHATMRMMRIQEENIYRFYSNVETDKSLENLLHKGH